MPFPHTPAHHQGNFSSPLKLHLTCHHLQRTFPDPPPFCPLKHTRTHTHTHTQPTPPHSFPVHVFLQARTPHEYQLSVREGSAPGLSPWLVDGRLLPRLSHHLPSTRASVPTLPVFIRHQSYGISWYLLGYLCKYPVSKYSHILRSWELGFNMRILQDTIQLLTMAKLNPFSKGWSSPYYP